MTSKKALGEGVLAPAQFSRNSCSPHVNPVILMPRVFFCFFPWQPGLSVNATPSVIMGDGSIVNVSWSGLAFPNPLDWFGLWCTGADGQPPLPMTAAPVKYNIANVSRTWAAGTGFFLMFIVRHRRQINKKKE